MASKNNHARRYALVICVWATIMGLTSGCIGSSNSTGSGGNGADPTTSADTSNQAADGPEQAADQDSSTQLLALRKFPLESLSTSTVTIGDNTFRVWLAISFDQTQEGLMYVSQDRIADDQGMLFVFDRDDFRAFWMKNTITPLDIAFIRSDGTIVKIHTMPRLTLQTFPSLTPARFALEVKAGAFAQLGIREGDRVDIPADVFKASP